MAGSSLECTKVQEAQRALARGVIACGQEVELGCTFTQNPAHQLAAPAVRGGKQMHTCGSDVMNLFNRRAMKRYIDPTPILADHLATLDTLAEMIVFGRLNEFDPRTRQNSTFS